MLKEAALEQKESRYNIRAVDRAVRILSVLSDGRPRTLTELSEAIEINSSTTFRLLATLACSNYVERIEQSGAYRLGLACLELSRAYHESNDIRQSALPELEMLRDDTKETVHLAILDKMEVVYVEKLHGLHAIGLMSSRLGGRSPAYCTGVGKVLLAHTDPGCQFSGVNVPPVFGKDAPLVFGKDVPPLFGQMHHSLEVGELL